MIYCTVEIDGLYFQFTGPTDIFGMWLEWILKTFKSTYSIQFKNVSFLELDKSRLKG